MDLQLLHNLQQVLDGCILGKHCEHQQCTLREFVQEVHNTPLNGVLDTLGLMAGTVEALHNLKKQIQMHFVMFNLECFKKNVFRHVLPGIGGGMSFGARSGADMTSISSSSTSGA